MSRTNEFNPAILLLPQSDAELAARVQGAIGGEIVACNAQGQPRLQDILPNLFGQGRAIVGLCASGILIRLVAAQLTDKFEEPPLISVSGDGAHIVPLLGGHRGANQLAAKLANAIGATAAITTASEGQFKFALDNPPPPFFCATPERTKALMVKALAGEPLRVDGPAKWLADAGYNIASGGEADIVVTNSSRVSETALVFRQKNLVLGMGCARHTPVSDLNDLLDTTLKTTDLSRDCIAAIASIDVKADEQGLHDLAAQLDVPLKFLPATKLAQADVPNPSKTVLAEVGTPSVSEAAASQFGALRVEKNKSANATLAISQLENQDLLSTAGRRQGSVHLVGIGPGEPSQRTASAVHALSSCTDWVGYGFYLDLIADLKTDHTEHRFGLGDEEPRVRHALELAAEGKTVSLVCSGDAQIYAMGALAFELLHASGERALSDGAQRVEVMTHPGVSAFQMASARAGALIGHDFCCISLSDLLTPREDILMRLDAAAAGDFVTAFYNPRSQRRTDLIEIAKQKYLAHRPADTPVIIARQLGRPEEDVKVVTLADFDPQSIDMMTIVLFGSSQSKSFERGNGSTVTFTPRGYAKKAATENVSGECQ